MICASLSPVLLHLTPFDGTKDRAGFQIKTGPMGKTGKKLEGNVKTALFSIFHRHRSSVQMQCSRKETVRRASSGCLSLVCVCKSSFLLSCIFRQKPRVVVRVNPLNFILYNPVLMVSNIWVFFSILDKCTVIFNRVILQIIYCWKFCICSKYRESYLYKMS